MKWRESICLIYGLLSAALHAVRSQALTGKLVPPIVDVCVGSEYEVGCGLVDGTRVMSVTRLILHFHDLKEEITECGFLSNGCRVIIQSEGDVEERPLKRLYREIVGNCEGKPSCNGTIPPYVERAFNFPYFSYELCGFFTPEYLSYLTIVTECSDVDAARPVTDTAPFVDSIFELPTTTLEPSTTNTGIADQQQTTGVTATQNSRVEKEGSENSETQCISQQRFEFYNPMCQTNILNSELMRQMACRKLRKYPRCGEGRRRGRRKNRNRSRAANRQFITFPVFHLL